ncbi:MAG TPA: DUF402 domain-containing protein [Ktedonobacteraceae bacterium]|nr:DUF402 domain-containing protein [Ktedonobacteraceae bacterium]
MQQNFQVESRSYDHILRGSWQAYMLDEHARLGDETGENTGDVLRFWLPAGTPMNWLTGTRPLRSNCLQFFWSDRWYMLSAFYEGSTLLHTYATMIQPVTLSYQRLSYVDLDLSMLVEPDLSYEVLTQIEFEQAATMLHYDEQTRIGALMALETLTSSMHLNVGVFSHVPYHLNLEALQPSSCGFRS